MELSSLNILTIRIRCSTNIHSSASSLFFSFCDGVNSPFFAKSAGQKILSGRLRGFFVGILIDNKMIHKYSQLPQICLLL